MRAPSGHRRTAVTVLAGLLLAGCASVPTRMPTAPSLTLLDAADLSLPGGCEPSAGAVYRTRYVVEPDGRVTGAIPESGSGCVQDALRRWVESFRYAPPDGRTAAVVDWMVVTAPRG